MFYLLLVRLEVHMNTELPKEALLFVCFVDKTWLEWIFSHEIKGVLLLQHLKKKHG
jgi:hypothetical protein